MIPCLDCSGGNSHDALMLVELAGVRVKLPGALDGTKMKDLRNEYEFEYLYEQIFLYFTLKEINFFDHGKSLVTCVAVPIMNMN